MVALEAFSTSLIKAKPLCSQGCNIHKREHKNGSMTLYSSKEDTSLIPGHGDASLRFTLLTLNSFSEVRSLSPFFQRLRMRQYFLFQNTGHGVALLLAPFLIDH